VEGDAPAGFSEQLEGWLASDAPKTLGGLGEVFSEKTFAVAVLLLMFPAALPLPTGGVTHVLEAIAVLVAIEMVLGLTTIWLPKRWRGRELGAAVTGKALPVVIRWVRRLERFSKPRAAAAMRSGPVRRLLGVVLIALAVAAGLAPPFSGLDTLPALAAVVVCLAIILEDAAILVVGLVVGVIAIVLEVALGAAVVRFFRSLW
jgi:hypothetical protein